MRHAFILGSNGPKSCDPLKYAHSDAEEIASVLSQPKCGFSTKLIKAGVQASEIRSSLYSMAEACSPSDSFLCYFSGHGVLERGELMLLLDHTEPDKLLGTSLPVADIIRAVSFCAAKNKFIILDCCHAGAVVNMIGLKDGSKKLMQEVGVPTESFLILMASGRLERAREVDYLKGSFLTKRICQALETNFDDADKDKDGAISVEDLKQFIDEGVAFHNTLYKDKIVPVPELFGRQKGSFSLTIGSISEWTPYEIEWPDQIKMVALPIKPFTSADGIQYATCISKYPITNKQYSVYMKSKGVSEPYGKVFVKKKSKNNDKFDKYIVEGKWKMDFYPMRENEFSDDNKPVVCVSYYDAHNYSEWLNENYSSDLRYFGRARLPSPELWDFAAFGTKYPTRDPDNWLKQTTLIHHKGLFPAEIELTETRTNPRGISDMFGNVWEWCRSSSRFIPNRQNPARGFPTISLGQDGKYISIVNLRGGGYLDDLEKIEPFLDGSHLASGETTKHSDLGFRIGCRIRMSLLSQGIQFMLKNFRYPEIHFPQ